jgi:predicted transcriptional regulator
MRAVTVTVEPLDAVNRRMTAAIKGKVRGAYITFPTHELMWKILTPKRWPILKAMIGAGVLGVREIARLVQRDVKGVHTDLQALAKAGVSTSWKTISGSAWLAGRAR